MKNKIFFIIFIIIIIPQLITAEKKLNIIINKEKDNTVLKGYDVVSYFTENKAVKGNNKYSFEYLDSVWLFSSSKNLELFKENPDKYIPQYGGFCAYAMAKGNKAPIDPEVFKIVNNKLYLNYNKSIGIKWQNNMNEYIIKADKNWLKLIKN